MQRELELKFEIAARDAERLARHPVLAWSPVSEQHQESLYFDTPKRKLRRAGYTIRVRRSGKGVTQTIKSQGKSAGVFDRSEWEAPVRRMRPDFNAARLTPLADVLTERTEKRLQPLVRMDIERTTWAFDDGPSLIEVTADYGVLKAGGAEQAINELEVELKRGSESALFDLTEEIARHLPLRLNVRSKADQAFALADGRLGRVRKAPRIDLSAGMNIADGFAAIALSCLKHFRLNEPLLVDQHLPEALHQARVAMRRLRSAFNLFRPILGHDPEYERLRKLLRRFNRRLGSARNLDVFLERLREDGPEPPQLLHLRDERYARLIVALDSRRFLRMMLRIVRWLHIGDWRERPEAKLPLEAFLDGRIDEQWAKLNLVGVHLASLDDERLHRFRIEIKNFRYSLEFARSLHQENRACRKSFGAAIEELQDQLGLLNDMVIARRIVRKHLDGVWPRPRTLEVERDPLLAKAENSFARLLEFGPYWQGPATALAAKPPAAAFARRRGGSVRPAASRRRAPRSGGSARG